MLYLISAFPKENRIFRILICTLFHSIHAQNQLLNNYVGIIQRLSRIEADSCFPLRRFVSFVWLKLLKLLIKIFSFVTSYKDFFLLIDISELEWLFLSRYWSGCFDSVNLIDYRYQITGQKRQEIKPMKNIYNFKKFNYHLSGTDKKN